MNAGNGREQIRQQRDLRRVAGVDAPQVGGAGHPPVTAQEVRAGNRIERFDLVERDVRDVVEQVDRNVEQGFVDQPGFDAAQRERESPLRDGSYGDEAGGRENRTRHGIRTRSNLHGGPPFSVDEALAILKLISENLSSRPSGADSVQSHI